MSRAAYAEYGRTSTWKWLRTRALERDRFACRVCGSSHRLEVHHRRYPKVWGEESVDDLTTLCHNCHSLFSKPSWGLRRILWLVLIENFVLTLLLLHWLR